MLELLAPPLYRRRIRSPLMKTTREGVRPKKKSQQGRFSLLKVQPTDSLGPMGSFQLRSRSDACFLINMHASIKAGAEWIKYTNDGCYGTDYISITPQFLLVAFRFAPTRSEEIWSIHSAVAPAATASTPAAFIPHSTSIGSAQQCSVLHFHLKMCFSPQQLAIFRHLNFKKCSETLSFLTFSLENVLLATAACHFSTSQLQKVLRS